MLRPCTASEDDNYRCPDPLSAHTHISIHVVDGTQFILMESSEEAQRRAESVCSVFRSGRATHLLEVLSLIQAWRILTC